MGGAFPCEAADLSVGSGDGGVRKPRQAAGRDVQRVREVHHGTHQLLLQQESLPRTNHPALPRGPDDIDEVPNLVRATLV